MTNTVLDELLKDNFEQYQVLWGQHQFHSHNAHHLGSLALLGASDEQLRNIYENTMRHYVEKYEPSPHDVTRDNWRESIGDGRFCSAYRDFFDKELPTQGDWKKKFFELLLDDAEGPPLIDAVLSGLLHPLIHIDYAIELNSRPVACEALTMTAVCSDLTHQMTTKVKPPTNGTKTALQIMKDIRLDDKTPTFDKPFQFAAALAQEALLLGHYNEWHIPDDVDKAIEELFDMTVYIYAATHKPGHIDFDFVLLHLLTGMNAIRKLRPSLDERTIRRLLCSFFYLSLVIYIVQYQPKIDEQLIDDFKVEERKNNWKYVVDQTLQTKIATEVHAVKVIRALRDAENDYGSKEGLYLKAAIKTVDNLNMEAPWDYRKYHEPWVGMPDSSRELNVKH